MIRDRAAVTARVVAQLRDAGCVFAEDEAGLLFEQADDAAELEAMVARRVAGEPLEVVLGWAYFDGLRVRVDPGVFVPRRRTTFLARQAVSISAPGAVVLDLCCGTGAIGLVVGTAVPGVDLHACDIDPVAVRCAARNVAAVGGQTYCGDLFDPLPDRLRGRVDVVVVNAPYVPTAEIEFMPSEARDHEPRHSLDGGADGVAVHRRVGAEVGEWLRGGGCVLIETGAGQADLTGEALSTAGLATVIESSDELGAIVAVGRKVIGPGVSPAR